MGFPVGFGYRGGGRKGLAGRMNKIKKSSPKKSKPLPKIGFK